MEEKDKRFKPNHDDLEIISEDDEPELEHERLKVPKKEADVKPNNERKRQRKLTSEVWVNYEFIEPQKNGELRCRCKKCGKEYNAESKSGTGNLKRHLDTCKKRSFRDIGQMLLDSSGGSLANRAPTFDANVFRELLTMAIVKHELPFQFVEYDGIRKCFNYLNPDLNVVSRNTIKADLLKKYKNEKLRVKEALSAAPGRIALTSDCWTSITTDGYMSLTAHFIDSEWRLQKIILNFSFLPPPHTGLAMCNHICSLLKDWGIQKKVFSITLDNACANDCMAEFLRSEMDLVCEGVYFHVRCCAHIMNLIVQDGLKEIDEAIYKVRESVKYCKGSQSRKQKFYHSVAHVELQSSRGLRQDVPTRWNSTYLMLDSVLYYKKAFIHLQRTDANYVNCPNNEEWGRIERIFKFLKVFYDVTNAFSGSKYPTANLYFPNVLKVRVLLHQEKDSLDKFMHAMANRMYHKFEKYWAEFSTIMAIAAVLDPRYKLKIVEWGYEKVYGDGYKIELDVMKGKLISLFNEYMDESTTNKATDEGKSHDATSDANSDALMEDFDSFSTKVTANKMKSEIDHYLEEQLIPRTSNINILQYWNANEIRYPTLARMARDILAIPISTVASESAFSTGGRVLDPYRSSLKPSIVEGIICLKDWVYGEAKMQPQLEELCGAVMKMNVHDDGEAPIDTPAAEDSNKRA